MGGLFSATRRANPKTTSAVAERGFSDGDLRGLMTAISLSLAMIRFSPDGLILYANESFLQLMGYTLEEIEGKHHRIFVDAEYAASEAYRRFWTKLRNGEFDQGEYKRLGRGGKEIWI